MIILLHGPDAYRRREKLEAIAAEYVKKHSALSAQSFDFGETGALERLEDALLTRSLFDSFRFIKVTNAFEVTPDDAPAYAELLKSVLETKDIVVVLSAEGAPLKAFQFLLEAPATSQEFPIWNDAKFGQFAVLEAKKLGLALTPADLNRLVGVCAGDGFCLSNELQKAALGGAKVAGASFTPGKSRESLFDSALRLENARGVREALPVLEALLLREDSAPIFNMLAALAAPKDKARFADYDVAIKSGKMDYEVALTDYVIGGCI